MAERRLIARARVRLSALRYPEGADAAEHWQRIVLDRAIDGHLRALDPPRRTAVEISGRAHAGRPWKRYEELSYPEFDVCAPLVGHDRYDVVICEQVLEHVPNPIAAMKNLAALCAPGGHVVVSTPFLVRIHELWGMQDYWRFTPRGLRTLLEGAGLEVERVESWGNRDVIDGNFDRWSKRRPWHSMRNEPELPIQVWAVARKP